MYLQKSTNDRFLETCHDRRSSRPGGIPRAALEVPLGLLVTALVWWATTWLAPTVVPRALAALLGGASWVMVGFAMESRTGREALGHVLVGVFTFALAVLAYGPWMLAVGFLLLGAVGVLHLTSLQPIRGAWGWATFATSLGILTLV